MWSIIKFEVIFLPAKKQVKKKELPNNKKNIFSYKVKPGETINYIALKFDVSAQSIVSLNGPKIYTGQSILIAK